MLSRYIDHHKIYLFGLIALSVSLPLSIFTTSVAEIILVANWLLEGKFYEKWEVIKKRKSLWFIASIYLVHILGLIFTTDFGYAFHDLKIKLPFLILPLVIGTSGIITRIELKWLLVCFIGAVTAATLASASVLFGLVDYAFHDVRQISLFVDHIRFSLLINIALYSGLYLLISTEYPKTSWETGIYTVLVIWLVIFLLLLQAITGILVFFITGFILFWINIRHINNVVVKWFLAVMIIIMPLMIVSYLSKVITGYYTTETIVPGQLEKLTKNGRPYKHDLSNKQFENGHYVWLYVCEEEIRQEWNRVSRFNYDGKDQLNQELKYTLIRYMTSRGLRKDSLGFSRLSEKDIALVESGIANHIYGKRTSLYPKIYEIIWQVDIFRRGGNPSGHSITQRILYLQAAMGIIKNNFITGVGTGDVAKEFNSYYEQTGSKLDPRWRLRAHNQYLTFFLTFGCIGFIWIIFSLVYPAFMEKKWNDYFFLMFFIIGMISMLNEDTLETHIGNSFFSFFYALFLLGIEKRKKYKINE